VEYTGSSSGLGLYISRGIARQMGGDLMASSEGLGKGCTFTFTFQAGAHTGPVSPEDAFRGGRTIRVSRIWRPPSRGPGFSASGSITEDRIDSKTKANTRSSKSGTGCSFEGCVETETKTGLAPELESRMVVDSAARVADLNKDRYAGTRSGPEGSTHPDFGSELSSLATLQTRRKPIDVSGTGGSSAASSPLVTVTSSGSLRYDAVAVSLNVDEEETASGEPAAP